MNKFKLGLIINPIAGMGGTVGLKGTDGSSVLKKAIKLGAKPNATNRTKELLIELESIKSKIKFITCPGDMGENVLKELNFEYELITNPLFIETPKLFETSEEHSIIAAEIMKNYKDMKLVVFVGGDGTARDILRAIKMDIPCLGVPAGVKIYSGVFALNPKIASSLIMQFLWGEIPLKESEVLDIDEDSFRDGKLVSKLFGYMLTPFAPDFSQRAKMGSPDSDLNNQERIAKRIIETLENDVYYLLGPGTTIKAITDQLNVKKTVLGVDLLLNKEIIKLDLNESQLLSSIQGKNAKIIVSPIGRQGFIFGRGNLQLSPQVLRKIGTKNIIVILTKNKIQNIPNQILRLDTRSTELDEEMRGFYKVILDYDEIKICKVE